MTHLYRTVNIGFAAGSGSGEQFGDILASLVGSFIGANLLFRDMPAVSELMGRRSGCWLRVDELETAWRGWKDAKNRVWVF